MISDVLSDASGEIKRWLIEWPAYRRDPTAHALILTALAAMNAAREYLDYPPTDAANDVEDTSQHAGADAPRSG